MELEAAPALTEVEVAVLLRGLELAGEGLDPEPAAYTSPWRRAAAEEAVDTVPGLQRADRTGA